MDKVSVPCYDEKSKNKIRVKIGMCFDLLFMTFLLKEILLSSYLGWFTFFNIDLEDEISGIIQYWKKWEITSQRRNLVLDRFLTIFKIRWQL